VAMWSKACACNLLIAGIGSSNPADGMECWSVVFVVCCVSSSL
jgi:hypothetical protein